MKKLLCAIIVLALLVSVAAAEGTGDSEAALRDRLIRATGTPSIAQFDCADYDGDGTREAFALVSAQGETGTGDALEGEVWFVSSGGCVRLHDRDSYLTVGKVGVSPCLYSAETWYGGSGSSSIVWGVSGGEAFLVGSGFEGLGGGDVPNEFYMYPSAFDLSSDGTGHTWKRYYFFLEGRTLKEYGGLSISRAELEKVPGAREILAGVEAEGWTIGEIYYRGNNIINVNLHDSWSNNNLTLRYESGSVTDTGERYGGSYQAASGLAEAVYPSVFPQGGGSLFFLPDLSDELLVAPQTPAPTKEPAATPKPAVTKAPAVEPKTTTASGDSVYVDSDVNLRKRPSLDADIITSIKAGTTVQFLGEVSTDERGVDWYKVSYKGHKGWTSSRYSHIADSGSGSSGKKSSDKQSSGKKSASGSTTATTTGDVNLRDEPSLDGDVIISIPEGTRLEYLGKVSTDERGVDWYRVSYKGHKGWASSKYTRLN